MHHGLTRLTARETEILSHIAHGRRTCDIARTLGISTRSVERHLTHLFVTLQVVNRTAAAAIYWQHATALTPTGESESRR